MSRVHRFTSSVLGPADRGVELGEHHREDVARTVAAYRRLFAARATGPFDVDAWSERAWATISELAPAAADEIAGVAEGARLPVREVAMLNARTELLAVADPTGMVPECSSVVSLPRDSAPVAVQTWDWYDAMADGWFAWTIPHPDGRELTTVTEFGVLGKIGVSSHGVGVLFNMLRHRDDGLAVSRGLGYPVHLLSRRILDQARDVEEAVAIARSVRTSASTSLTLVDDRGAAVSVELSPGGPALVRPEDGVLVRTNHFVSEEHASGCLASAIGPGSGVRRTTLLDAFGQPPADSTDVVTAMDDHREVGAVCAHPDPSLDPALRHATLATVVLDVADRSLGVTAGGPCARAR